jgi:ubiquinone/menaquinone biosynthesis C-methylase UbiE
MPEVLYSGKLSPLMKLVVNVSCLYAWITGYGRDTAAMTANVKRGYEGEYTDDIYRYDECGCDHYKECAEMLVEDMDLHDKEVLDVGCGTGILSFCVLEKGAARVICSELSELMLNKCRENAGDKGYDRDRAEFRQCNAVALPFEEKSFDVVVSGMVLGMVPDQLKAVSEMARVVRPGGMVALSTHGNKHYLECIEAGARIFSKPRYLLSALGVRPEYWLLNEKSAARLLGRAGLADIKVKRHLGKECFQTSDQTFDFWSSTSGQYYAGPIPAKKREAFFVDARECFRRKDIREVTKDVVFAYGKKPA